MITYANMLQAVASHCLNDPDRSIHLTDAQIRSIRMADKEFQEWARRCRLTATRADYNGHPGYYVQAKPSNPLFDCVQIKEINLITSQIKTEKVEENPGSTPHPAQ